MGWPAHIEGWNKGRRALVDRLLILKDKALNDMVKLQDFPLRSGDFDAAFTENSCLPSLIMRTALKPSGGVIS